MVFTISELIKSSSEACDWVMAATWSIYPNYLGLRFAMVSVHSRGISIEMAG